MRAVLLLLREGADTGCRRVDGHRAEARLLVLHHHRLVVVIEALVADVAHTSADAHLPMGRGGAHAKASGVRPLIEVGTARSDSLARCGPDRHSSVLGSREVLRLALWVVRLARMVEPPGTALHAVVLGTSLQATPLSATVGTAERSQTVLLKLSHLIG